MIVKVKRVWYGKLTEYKEVLDKYNAEIHKGEDGCEIATIEVEDVETLFNLAKELDEDLIINRLGNCTVDIYDDYIE